MDEANLAERAAVPAEKPVLNEHNKDEYPPMHTVEHILNQTMIRMFGCPRAMNAHIEKKKSKCDYDLPAAPTSAEVAELVRRVNEVISLSLPVYDEYLTRDKAELIVDLRKLPPDATEILRIVRIGDYDACACIGAHVSNTSEIAGSFTVISSSWADGKWRIRFRLEAF